MLQTLDHFTVRAGDLDRTAAFYHRLLGLAPGPRPPFAVPGHWFYAAGRPLVHLLQAGPSAPAGTIDHVAFVAYGRAALERRLLEAGVAYRLLATPDGSAPRCVPTSTPSRHRAERGDEGRRRRQPRPRRRAAEGLRRAARRRAAQG